MTAPADSSSAAGGTPGAAPGGPFRCVGASAALLSAASPEPCGEPAATAALGDPSAAQARAGSAGNGSINKESTRGSGKDVPARHAGARGRVIGKLSAMPYVSLGHSATELMHPVIVRAILACTGATDSRSNAPHRGRDWLLRLRRPCLTSKRILIAKEWTDSKTSAAAICAIRDMVCSFYVDPRGGRQRSTRRGDSAR